MKGIYTFLETSSFEFNTIVNFLNLFLEYSDIFRTLAYLENGGN